MRKRFRDCLFDSETRELFRAGRTVHLSPKGYTLLDLLLRNAPKAVSKGEIQAEVWGQAFLSESSLTNIVAEVRAALGDRARKPALLRTVHGFGYAFCGEAIEEAERGKEKDLSPFRLSRGNRRFALSEGENILGRDPAADVHIEHRSVSRRHARISIRSCTPALEDLQSRNGTFLGGRRIDRPTKLHDGDVIGLGPVTLTFEALTAEGSTDTDLTV
jgi:DNA-binding winged helix-turn-helix (wHTH) protein